ncbi:hypothetical protein Htur_4922 (plasmid) [Haloterrigena turkmenica DSM 5511]|uniref:Uncharacterized protein n=1 Tax=Haloterrigena turkmenica (strain ATCC 51198 / DSM 5511 / JCM 9101 / NCIMB 13204 / VKM B-1734 / 4k) TaxID=543526 RepID=D2S2R2_HALTV|nr:hypothetical protein [Haloterrigena turkmenica]ADB63659.1 hypothetical protein Htur_4922 [Haloterrigena turkmenica DSM 5511]
MSDPVHTCPAPDGCNFTTDEISELTAHINTEHAGEYTDPRWPDTPAGRASRAADGGDEDDQGGTDE